MTHIFAMESGTLHLFDLNMAMETVLTVKMAISRRISVPPEKQVLLISGGEVLKDSDRISDKGAGTDENPVFLFSLLALESPDGFKMPPVTDRFQSLLVNDQDVKSTLSLLPSLETILFCSEELKRFEHLAQQLADACEMSVFEQRMQYQGWLAVLANLDDIICCCEKVNARLLEDVNAFEEEKENKSQILASLPLTLDLLRRLPIPPTIDDGSSEFIISLCDQQSVHESDPSRQKASAMTLFDWIQNQYSSLLCGSILDYLNDARENFHAINIELMRSFAESSFNILDEIKNCPSREVLGIGERLHGIQTYSSKAKENAKHIRELAESVNKSKQKFLDDVALRHDASMIEDVCNMHHKIAFTDASSRLKENADIWKSLCNCKQDLIRNLHSRLRLVMKTQMDVDEIDLKARLFMDHLNNVNQQFRFVMQLKCSPAVYSSIICECRRRNLFAAEYNKLTRSICDPINQWFNEEMNRRREFVEQNGKHFLINLIPQLLRKSSRCFIRTSAEGLDEDLPIISDNNFEAIKLELEEFVDSLESFDTGDVDYRDFTVDCLKAFQQADKIQGNKLRNLAFRPYLVHSISSQTNTDELETMEDILQCLSSIDRQSELSNEVNALLREMVWKCVEKELIVSKERIKHLQKQINCLFKKNRSYAKQLSVIDDSARVLGFPTQSAMSSSFHSLQSCNEYPENDVGKCEGVCFSEKQASFKLAVDQAVKRACFRKDTLISQLQKQLRSSSAAMKKECAIPVSENVLDTRLCRSSSLDVPSDFSSVDKSNELLDDKSGTANRNRPEYCEKVSVFTCNKADKVIISYSEKFNQYVICNAFPLHCFVHTDSFSSLNLNDLSSPTTGFIFAEVKDKEYCIVKRENNRFNLPLGTKFCRVRCIPWSIRTQLTASMFSLPFR